MSGTTRLRRYVESWCDGPFGSAISSDHYVQSGARVVRLGNIGSAEWRDHDTAYLDLDYWKTLSRHHVRCGDLVVAALGDDNNPVGRAAVVPHLGPALVKADCHRLRLRSGVADARFLAYYLASDRGSFEAARMADGSTRKRLTLSKTLGLPVPDVEARFQRRIANFLDAETARIDALINAKQQMDKALAARSQAVTDETVTSSTSVQVRHVVSRLTSGPRGWAQYVAPTGSLFLRITNVQRDDIELDLSNSLFVDAPSTPETARSRTHEGDVVVSITADIGSVGIVRAAHAGANVSQHLALITPERCEPEWLAYAITTTEARAQLDAGQYGGTKTQLSLDDIASLRIPMVDEAAQRERVTRLRRIGSATAEARESLGNQIELLREHRRSLITAAVTGELEVA